MGSGMRWHAMKQKWFCCSLRGYHHKCIALICGAFSVVGALCGRHWCRCSPDAKYVMPPTKGFSTMMVLMLAMTVEGSQDHIGVDMTHDDIVA